MAEGAGEEIAAGGEVGRSSSIGENVCPSACTSDRFYSLGDPRV